VQESARVLAHEPGQQNSSFHAEAQVLLTQPLKHCAIRASKLATILYASVERYIQETVFARDRLFPLRRRAAVAH
jgi:hypothetical protein